MAHGHHLQIRLFLEGIEVPVVAATVQVAANTPASASIQVIATDAVLNLHPRTVVHLFYFDYIGAGATSYDQHRESDDEVDEFNRKYKLLFMGELVSIQFQKSAGQRAVILRCSDFSNYWDTTFQYNFNGSLFGGRRQAAFIGANSNFFNSPLGHGVGTIARLLNGRSKNYPELRGLLAGIVRMLEAIGGSYYGRNTFRGANDFTSIAELRLKILQQITAAEKDTSTVNLFTRKAFNMWMNRQVGQLGRLVSFRGLTKMLFKFIFYECYPCPVARYVPAGERTAKSAYSQGLKDNPRYKQFWESGNTALNWVIIARDSLRDYDRDKRTQNQQFINQSKQTYRRHWRNAARAVKEAHALANAIGLPGNGAGLMGMAKTEIGKIEALSSKAGFYEAEHYYVIGALDQQSATIVKHLTRAEEFIRKALGVKLRKTRRYKEATQPRLNNQIFRPDIYFAPPPRCNVLFPELYDSFSFTRQYLREVSRMELQTHNEILGNHALFNGRYYAPNVADVRQGLKLGQRRFARLILNHELFTGIVPMFENMTEANLFAMRSGKVTQGGSKVSYAQRAVNYQYFKYRFESRGMEASGRFNPVFVPGFPSLIIDRYLNQDDLQLASQTVGDAVLGLDLKTDEPLTQAELLKLLVSPQYLGVCASLTHQVTQDGGRTNYAFIHARVHRESTEYMGVDKASVMQTVGRSTRKSVVAAPVSEKPKAGQVGVYGGEVVSVRDVSSQHQGKTLVLFGAIVGKSAGNDTANYGDTQKAVVGDRLPVYSHNSSEQGLLVGAYEIRESRPVRKLVDVDYPIEEAIRPPWIWDGWANPKIGETYTQFFGTTAVTDVAGFNAAVQDQTLLGSDDLEALRKEQRATASGRKKRSPASRRDPRSQAITDDSRYQLGLRMKEEQRTVENSIDFLVRAYSYVKANNLDVGDFLKSYCWRPVATILDILGEANFKIRQVVRQRTVTVRQRYLERVKLQNNDPKFDEDGRLIETPYKSEPIWGTRYIKRRVYRTEYTTEGKEGFHSRAFGDDEDLFGLVSPTVRRVLGLSTHKRKVAAKLDVRKRRRDQVRTYVDELTHSRGLLG